MLQRLSITAATVLIILCVFSAILFSAGGQARAGCDYLNWKHYPYPIPGVNITIPDDDGKHSLGFSTEGEWWYASFHLTSNTGHHYGAFVAFFRTLFVRELKVFSISDIDQDTNYTYSNTWGTLIAGADHLDLTYTDGTVPCIDRWYNKYPVQLMPFKYKLLVNGESREDGSSMKLDLDMESMKAPTYASDTGVVGVGNTWSYYYSHPRVNVSGQMIVGGQTQTVTGTAWIDHQYGYTDTSEYVSWEWFAITLNDSREIMVADAWLNGIHDDTFSAALNFYDENCVHTALYDYTLTPVNSSFWIDPLSHYRFATQWHLVEPVKDIDLLITADYKNQVMHIDEAIILKHFLPKAFWEGVCTVSGTIGNAPISGIVYGELTHVSGWPLPDTLKGSDSLLPKRYSPYLVVCDVTLPQGFQTRIEPGVEILFVGDYKFDVYGTLKAMGTVGDSVVFTHYTNSPDSTWRGLRFHNASPACTLKYCIIEYGDAHGGGTDGNGGGLYCQNSSPVVSHCTIRNNGADGQGGGVSLMSSNATFDRCLIVQNSDGGIYYGGSSNITLNHCTISDNDDYGIQSPASEFPSWHMTAANTIVYDNYGESVISTNRSFTANYCDIADYYYGGTGNIDCDPQFVNYYHLDSGSCCINAGDPAPSNNDPDNTRGDIGVFYRPQSSCPYVSVWNGSGFVRDNNILPQSEGARDNQNVTDYYRLRDVMPPGDGRYRLRIEEFEQECTSLDGVVLEIIDHPESSQLAVADDGRYYTYSKPVPPVSATNTSGDNLVAFLSADDGKAVGGNADHEITLDFGSIDSEYGARLLAHFGKNSWNDFDVASQASMPAVPVTPVPQKPTIGISGPIGNEKTLPTIGQPDNSECAQRIVLRPRENKVIAIADVTSLLPPKGERFIISLTVPTGYHVDFVGLDCTPQTPLEVRRAQLTSAVHSRLGDVTDKLTRADGKYVELQPDQYLDFLFEYADLPDGLASDFILVSTGRYSRYQPSLDAGNSDQGAGEIRNYPNPFNPMTTIQYYVQSRAQVTIEIFNLLGQRVRTLVNETKSAGSYQVEWNGNDDFGDPASTGVYLYRLKAGDFVQTKKMLLLK